MDNKASRRGMLANMHELYICTVEYRTRSLC